MLAGDLCVADDPELAEDNRRALRLMEELNLSPGDAPQDRRRILTELLGCSVRTQKSARRCTATTATRCASAHGRSSTSVS